MKPGFVPRHNAMKIAQALGLYLSFYRWMKGPSARIPFPGTPGSWTAPHSDSFQDVVAHLHIHISLHPQKTHSRSFNVADQRTVTWEEKWPVVCRYFGFEGVAPSEEKVQGVDWLLSLKAKWPAWVKEMGLQENATEDMHWDIFTASFLNSIPINFHLSSSREIGFLEEVAPGEGFTLVFDRLRVADLLP